MTTKYVEKPRRFTNYAGYVIADSLNNDYSAGFDTNSFDVLDIESFSGADLPAYKSMIRSHVNCTNPATGTRSDTISSPGSFSVVVQRLTSDIDGNLYVYRSELSYGGGALISLPDAGGPYDNGSSMDQAIASFVSKARRATSPAQGGVILGEIRETLHGILHPANALRSAISGYLKNVKKRSRGLSKASNRKKNSMVASTWLEANLGWAPLLSDIDNSMEALSQITTGIRSTTPVRGRGESTDIISEYQVSTSLGPLLGTYSVTTKDVVKSYVYGGVDYSTDPAPSFRGAFGLRAHDILPTIWNLIPYSFVADYFTNIGDIISAASFSTSNLSWWGSSQTTDRVMYSHSWYDTTDRSSNPYAPIFGGGNPGSMVRTTRLFSRTVNPPLVPSLRFRIPGSPKVGFNLAALFAQARAIHF